MRYSTEQDYKIGSQTVRMHSCYYCGCIADTIDHVPPTAVRALMLSDRKQFGQYKFYEIPACTECNCLLGKKGWTPVERRALIVKKLLKKYRSVLEIPAWAPKEIEELSPLLQIQLRASIALQNLVRRRIHWARKGCSDLIQTEPNHSQKPGSRKRKKLSTREFVRRRRAARLNWVFCAADAACGWSTPLVASYMTRYLESCAASASKGSKR